MSYAGFVRKVPNEDNALLTPYSHPMLPKCYTHTESESVYGRERERDGGKTGVRKRQAYARAAFSLLTGTETKSLENIT